MDPIHRFLRILETLNGFGPVQFHVEPFQGKDLALLTGSQSLDR